MNSKREEYLEYLRLLYDREAGKGKQTGITKWALILAVVYVSWNFIDNFPKIRDNQIAIHSIFFLYGILHLAIVNFSDIINFPSGKVASKYTWRIETHSFNDAFPAYVSLGLSLGLPLLSQFSRDMSLYKTPGLELYGKLIDAQSTFNSWFLAVMVIVIPMLSIILGALEKRSGLPSPVLFLAAFKGNLGRGIWATIFLELALGNSVAAYLLATFLPVDQLHGILSCSLDMAVIIIALVYLFDSKSAADRVETISSLERDIIFHNVSDQEIKNRIQEEFIGHEVGEWLNSKLNEIRKMAAALAEAAESADNVKREIESLPENHLFEINGRVTKYIDLLKLAHEGCIQKMTPLVNWLEVVIKTPGRAKGKEVLDMLQDVSNELKQISTSMGDKVQVAITKVGALAGK